MSDLKKAQQLRARREMVRQKQQAAIEKRDTKANATRSENIARRKRAAEKVGKTFSYKDTVTPSVESGPLNYGSPMKKSSCIKMYDSKGKPAGLMAEGSMAYMESIGQEKKNLMQDMPVDDKASAMEMSPYKMDYGSPNKKTNLDEFGNPIPEGFKADAAGITGTIRKVTSKPIEFGDHGYGIRQPNVRDVEGEIIPRAGRDLRDQQDPSTSHPRYKGMIPSEELKGKKYLTMSLDKRRI
jgi:hypothetical protein